MLAIERKLFHKMLDVWLDDKKDYCERWNHFCGEMGIIRSSDYKKLDTTNLLNENNTFDIVNKFEILSFDSNTDMEHG